MLLVQEKLDVTAKKRSNLFNWRGQFTPEFVEYILESFARPGITVLDPFSGSGTVLQEAGKLGLNAIGLEINPAAYIMSNFFTLSRLSTEDRQRLGHILQSKVLKHLADVPTMDRVYINNTDYREAYSSLLGLAQNVAKDLEAQDEKTFFLNMLFQSEKDKKLTLHNSLTKSFGYLKKSLLELPNTSNSIQAFLMDARNSGEMFDNQVDMVFTSPPYINVFNYHQNYRAIIEAFHYNILKVAHSEFGSNRKNRGNRFKTVIQYCLDMELAIRALWKALKSGGKLIMVLGRESNVRGTAFYNGQLMMEILQACGGFKDIHTLERQFMNKFGSNIKEDVIIATKVDQLLTTDLNGRRISFRHLEDSLQRSVNGVSADIAQALLEIEQIQPSPLLNPNNILNV